MRKLWKKRSMMAILTAAMLMNDSVVTDTAVHAAEALEQSKEELDSGNSQTDNGEEAESSKTNNEEESENNKADDLEEAENDKADSEEESDSNKEDNKADSNAFKESSTADSQERSEQESSIRCIIEVEPEIQLRLVNQILSRTIHGVTVSVTGRMPENARLHVDEKTSGEEGMEYEIAILYEDGEYIPEEYGEEIQVSFEFDSKSRSAEEKIYTVYDIEEDSRQLGAAKTGGKTSFATDRLSRYVIIEEVNYEGVTLWEYDYIGNSQGFAAPVTGVYRFDLYGAQGSTYQEHQGGKGGMVSVQLELAKNEEVELIIGGTNGFHGGGTGKIANGGGATSLLIDGDAAAIAGGGGGATNLLDGGDGGAVQGEWGNTDIGDSSQSAYSAGGGGGYLGGKSGYTQYHNHTGSSRGGGCYTTAVRHVHIDSCYRICGTFGGFSVSSSNSDYIDANCDGCGEWGCRPGDMSSDFIHDGSWMHKIQICGKNPDLVEYYNLGCGKKNTTVEKKTKAYGGTSYYDSSVCENGIMTAGVQEGDGKVLINLLEMDGSTINYYNYDMDLLGSITVEKGGMANFPLTSTPTRAADKKYSYEFVGWDDMETAQEETMSNVHTIQTEVTDDRSYVAVYRNIPKKYSVTLENGEGAIAEVQAVTATFGQNMPDIKIPEKEGYLFAGYYTMPDGAGIQYYTPKGESARTSDITENSILYAYWVQPLTITAQPEDVILRKGYRGVAMETNYVLDISEGYSVELQWYVDKGTPEAIFRAKSKQLIVPTGYPIGTYKIWCELKVTSDYNGQNVTLLTDKADIVVMKGILQDKDVICMTPEVTYDGESHPVKARVNVMDDITIYYGEELLDADNYNRLGDTVAISYTNAGSYQVYVYITGQDYEDFAGNINMEIMKAKWVVDKENYPVVRKNGTVMFPGGESWEYYKDGQDDAEYEHYKGTKLSKGDYIFRIEEDENHYASDNVRLTVNPERGGSGQDNPGGKNETGGGDSGAESDDPKTGGGDSGTESDDPKTGGGDSGTENDNPKDGSEESGNDSGNTENNSKDDIDSGDSETSRDNHTDTDSSGRKTVYRDRKQDDRISKTTGHVNTTTGAPNKYLADRQGGSKDKLQSGVLERTKTNEIGIEQETQLKENGLERVEVSFVIGTMILIFLLIFLLLFLIRNRSEESNEEEKDFDNRK